MGSFTRCANEGKLSDDGLRSQVQSLEDKYDLELLLLGGSPKKKTMCSFESLNSCEFCDNKIKKRKMREAQS